MRVEHILEHKGRRVISMAAASPLHEAATTLAAYGVGAVLVRDEDGEIAGVLSERDLVRGAAMYGKAALDMEISELMTRDIVVCSPDDDIEMLMRSMTDRRIRHLPVVCAGQLVGLVSIGDVVKARIAEIESETEALREFIHAA